MVIKLTLSTGKTIELTQEELHELSEVLIAVVADNPNESSYEPDFD